MISKSEIEAKAKEFEINPANVQKDYVFGWVIFGIFTLSDLKNEIFLKGGNALRKGYLENTRFSGDLDFGTPNGIDQTTLLNELNKICDFVQEKTGISFVKESNRIDEKFTASEAPIPGLQVWEARIYFKDFYGNADHISLRISLDVTQFDRVLLPLQTVKLIHPYSDKDELTCEIRCMKLEEIIATKLKCLLQRQHAPDLFDYVYSMKLFGVSLNKKELVDAFVEKTIFSQNPHVLKNILQRSPFDYFRKFWAKNIICAKQILFEVEDAIKFFIADLEGLFATYPDTGYGAFAFFGPELRVPIMEAGRNQTLLKIRYNGADRIIEPYSLKYLQRKGGQQREYFYAYNRSGGGNAPGIRAFVSENVESIENTTENFEPRFQIELSKAGEHPENRYFFDPNKPFRQSQRKRITSFGVGATRIKYIYKCVYCGKTFTKTINNGILGLHKDKNGHACFGRHGVYVTTKYD